MAEASSEAKEEYDTQFFGFSPIAFTDGLFSAAVGYTEDAQKVLKEVLCKKFSDIMPPSEIESATDAYFATLEEPFNKCFDRLESYVTTSILHVPDHVLLPEDSVHDAPPSLLTLDLDQEIQDLENKIIAEAQRTAELKGELKMQETTVANMNTFMDDLSECKIEEFKETVGYCVQKAQEVLELVVDEETDAPKSVPVPGNPETQPKSLF